MMVKSILTVIVSCFFLPSVLLAIMPPEDLAQRNLEAKLILVGEVMETGKILLPEKERSGPAQKGLFVLRVLHVIKGFGVVKAGDQVRIVFFIPPRTDGTLVAGVMGSYPVKVESGNLAVVYIDPSEYPDFYRPVAAGSSVVTIKPSMKEQVEPEEKSQRK